MKLEKNKMIFTAVIVIIILFMGIYATTVLGDDDSPTIENNQIPVPKLEGGQKEYDSKLDALNDLKEVRQTNAPSIYVLTIRILSGIKTIHWSHQKVLKHLKWIL